MSSVFFNFASVQNKHFAQKILEKLYTTTNWLHCIFIVFINMKTNKNIVKIYLLNTKPHIKIPKR